MLFFGRQKKYRPISPYKKAVFGKHRVCRDYFYDRRQRLKKILILISFLLAFLGIIYVLFFTPLLNIRRFEVVREENIYYTLKNSEIETWAREASEGRWLWIISRRHRWFYPKSQVIKRIESVIPIENLDFKISLGGKLIFKIKDLYPVMSLENAGQWYYLRADGTVIKSVAENELDKNLPLVSFNPVALGLEIPEIPKTESIASSTSSTLELNLENETSSITSEALLTNSKNVTETLTLEQILAKLDQSRREFVLNLARSYPEIIADDQVLRVEFVDPVLPDALVKTKRGYRLYFDPKIDLEQQIKNFKLLKEQKLGGKKPTYIDLRYADRLYYKE